jgi:hypothetical protein
MIELKLTFDGRDIAGTSQILVGIIPMNINGLKKQSCKDTFFTSTSKCTRNEGRT